MVGIYAQRNTVFQDSTNEIALSLKVLGEASDQGEKISRLLEFRSRTQKRLPFRAHCLLAGWSRDTDLSTERLACGGAA